MMRLALILLCLATAAPAAEDVSAQALGWVNEFRSQNRRKPLGISSALTRAAAAHADDMAKRAFFDHTGSDGSTIGTRVKRQGYGFCFVAENIAMGQRDLGQALASWRDSKGHRRNMLERRATEIGVAKGAGNRWVMVLGTPGC